MTPTQRATLLCLLVASTEMVAHSFAPPSSRRVASKPHVLNAMERLHDPSTNAFGNVEHVYSLRDIDVITQRIADDEWAALGSVVAESMYKTILEVGEEALNRRGWVDRMSLTSRIAEEVSDAVEKALHKVRSQPNNTFDQGPHHLPHELIATLNTLLRHELGTIVGLEEGTETFAYEKRDLSLLVLSSVSDAIESYCGISNIHAPFFDLSTEMDHRIRNRRRDLLLKHSRGYENVNDVEDDIRSSRLDWVRKVLGGKAAANFEMGEVTTHDGNERSHEKERKVREERRSSVWNALFQDLDGALMP